MSLPVLVNILTIILCAAVLVQSLRMMRSLNAIRSGAMTEVVTALDASTTQARRVLSDLKRALGECEGGVQVVIDAKAICDELTVMVGIANASAERMVEAANGARRNNDEDRREEPRREEPRREESYREEPHRDAWRHEDWRREEWA